MLVNTLATGRPISAATTAARTSSPLDASSCLMYERRPRNSDQEEHRHRLARDTRVGHACTQKNDSRLAFHFILQAPGNKNEAARPEW